MARAQVRNVRGGGNPEAGCAELELSQRDLIAFAGRLEIAFGGTKGLVEMRYPGYAGTAAKMCRNEPVRYARLVVRLMDGEQANEIARKEGCDVGLVRCVRMLHPEIVAAGRAEILANLEEVSVRFTRRLLAEHDTLPIDKVPQALSVVIEKLALLSGGATARVEHASVPSVGELQKMFEALPRVKVVEPSDVPSA
jgi:hypothetical protein